jgi:deoxyribodipyrimidine photolyase-related protein
VPRCCLILGDQLCDSLSSLVRVGQDDFVLMAEVRAEASYVNHHKQKLALVFSAMRHFAQHLRLNGRNVVYVKLTDSDNTGDLVSELRRHQEKFQFSEWLITEPGEWRLKQAFNRLAESSSVPINILEDTRFVVSHVEFASFMANRKQPRMEHFYRIVRQRTGILMEGNEPCGVCWNFDHENRKSLSDHDVPEPPKWQHDAITSEVLRLVEQQFPDNFGELDSFSWPVTAEQAQELLNHFIDNCLPRFGDYQDAMAIGKDALFHSLISSSLNIGLLDAREICGVAEAAYRRGLAPINAVEGFIRQIIGWREYVRGLYWTHMPHYQELNHLEARRDLPGFYWDESKIDMLCLKEAIRNTRQHAYAHHIQRLMITGNFALLTGCDIKQVCEWYLSVYADAYEWVELPNTLGMALFADGGLLASKPYCASGKYIDRMSNYCRACPYDVRSLDSDDACPMNFLYWDFLITNAAKFRNNPRMTMMLKNLDRMPAEKMSAIKSRAANFKDTLI